VGAIAAALLAHAPPLLTTAMMFTSDGLATLLLVAGLWWIVERRSFGVGAVLLVLSVFSRPDSVILIGFWALLVAFLERRDSERIRLPLLGGLLAASVLAYAAVQTHAREYGWWPLFHISFRQKEAHPSRIPTAVDFDAYSAKIAEKAGEIPGVGYYLQGTVRGYPTRTGRVAEPNPTSARSGRGGLEWHHEPSSYESWGSLGAPSRSSSPATTRCSDSSSWGPTATPFW